MKKKIRKVKKSTLQNRADKECSKCHKTGVEFYKQHKECKECTDKINKEWLAQPENKEKNNEYRKKWFDTGDNRKRSNLQARLARKKMREERPLEYKALTFLSGLRWGKGAAVKMRQFLEKYINTQCKYCGTILTLTNASLDHKIPYPHRIYRKKSKFKKKEFSEEYKKFLNSEENLHIICWSCNRTKSDMTDEEYVSLHAFLHGDPILKDKILKRLRRSNMIFGR